ncbi:MAG TPA: hypothetical protein PK156_50375 [Polyangium sp.]|nr:hypothetical protein [Polyangium sp.]
MHRRSPRFALHVWLLPVVSLLVPPACSGSSRNVDAPKSVASASAPAAAAAHPPPDPCELAADLRKKVKPFLDEGRLLR